jgi:hypothetical protein
MDDDEPPEFIDLRVLSERLHAVQDVVGALAEQLERHGKLLGEMSAQQGRRLTRW